MGPQQRPPGLADPVDRAAVGTDRADPSAPDDIRSGPDRQHAGPAGAAGADGEPIPGLGQDGADRPDPVPVLAVVDEGAHIIQRRSNPTRAELGARPAEDRARAAQPAVLPPPTRRRTGHPHRRRRTTRHHRLARP